MLKIVSVLPPREGFNSECAGAVALYVHHYLKCDQEDVDHTVLGGWKGAPFDDVNYETICPPRFRLTSRSTAYAKSVAKCLKGSGFDLVEVHNRPAIALAIKKYCPDIKVSLFLHNDPRTMKELRSARILNGCVSLLDQFVAVSEFVARTLFDMAPLAAHKSTVVHNAIDEDWFISGLNSLSDKKETRVTYVGRIVPEKGVAEVAEAFGRVLSIRNDVSASILGGAGFGSSDNLTDFELHIKGIAHRSGKAFSFIGSQSNEFVLKHLMESDIVVVPSKVQEAFGRVLIEAMSQSNACICSPLGALPEVGGEAVIMLDEVSPDSIVRELLALIDTPSKLNEWKLKAKTRAQEFRVSECYPILREYRSSLVFGETSCNQSI